MKRICTCALMALIFMSTFSYNKNDLTIINEKLINQRELNTTLYTTSTSNISTISGEEIASIAGVTENVVFADQVIKINEFSVVPGSNGMKVTNITSTVSYGGEVLKGRLNFAGGSIFTGNTLTARYIKINLQHSAKIIFFASGLSGNTPFVSMSSNMNDVNSSLVYSKKIERSYEKEETDVLSSGEYYLWSDINVTLAGVVIHYEDVSVTYKKEEQIISTISHTYGTTATKPFSNPAIDGMEFTGWFTAQGILFDFDSILTSNITLYARFIKTPIGLESQNAENHTALRYISTITNTDFSKINDLRFVLSLDGVEKEVPIETIYTSVAGESSKVAKENTYYAILAISDLCSADTPGAIPFTLVSKVLMRVGGTTHISDVVVRTIYAKDPEISISKINNTEDYYYQISSNSASRFSYYTGYTYAGLINKDGTVHNEFVKNKTTGEIVDVINFGAKPNDPSFDNTQAFADAINSCEFGDEVYVPTGKYYFSSAVVTSPYYAHIALKAGVNMRGAGQNKSILVSNFQNGEYIHETFGKKTATLICGNMSNSTISDLGFSANTDDSSLPLDINATSVNNPDGNQHAPAFGIVAFNSSLDSLVENIYINNVYIEYFQYDGIRFYCTRNSKISNCVITKSTDIGGGGAGYGIELRGYGHEYFQYLDTNLDSCYNIVENNTIIGPYIRHGIILSYMTHNNLFFNNTVLDSADDAFDVHGQDEFLNVFAYNYAYGSRRGAGLGLGNTGSNHDASGYGNVLYKNVFENCRYGITVTLGTEYTQLIKNTIINCQNSIHIVDAPNTYQEGNVIS